MFNNVKLQQRGSIFKTYRHEVLIILNEVILRGGCILS
jgi:hypothetical protein